MTAIHVVTNVVTTQEEPQTYVHWIALKSNDGYLQGVLRDNGLKRAFSIVYEEIEDQYEGDFLEESASSLGILLILAKKCLLDTRFESDWQKLAVIVPEISAVIETVLITFEYINQDSSSESEHGERLRDSLLTMRLAQKLGQEVTIIPTIGEDPTQVTLISFPRLGAKDYARLWFSFNSEMLSKRVRWADLPYLVPKQTWDLSALA